MNNEAASRVEEFPCPSCSDVGSLHFEQVQLKLSYQGQTIEAEGDGTICSSCGALFMSDELTEQVVNQTNRIDQQYPNQYLTVDQASGKITQQNLH